MKAFGAVDDALFGARLVRNIFFEVKSTKVGSNDFIEFSISSTDFNLSGLSRNTIFRILTTTNITILDRY